MDALSQTFSALADPTRRAILARLADGDATVGELAEPFEMSLPAVSRHLKVLTQAGLIERSTEAQWRRCALRGEGLRAAADWIEFYRHFWRNRSTDSTPSCRGPRRRWSPRSPTPRNQTPRNQPPQLQPGRSAVSAALDDKTLRIVRVFNAPRERVFDAWIVQNNFIQWMCPPNVHVSEVKLDVRPGGAWHLRGRNASRNFVTSASMSRSSDRSAWSSPGRITRPAISPVRAGTRRRCTWSSGRWATRPSSP